MNRKQTMNLGQAFEYMWKHPPKPFNPDYDPKAAARGTKASEIVETMEPFESRAARAKAWREAYEDLKAKGE